MRIECENCSATYTIDDAQLGDQPIGAQCPYCGHVKVVRKPATASTDLGFGGGSGSLSSGVDLGLDGDFQASGGEFVPAPSSPSTSLDLGSAYDLDPRPPSPGQTAQELGFGGPPPQASDPFGFEQEPVSDGSDALGLSLDGSADFPAVPAADYPSGAGLTDLGPGLEPLPRPNSSDISFEVGPPPVGGDGALGESPAHCQECGTPLTDEFDKVIGLCEVHQQERRGTGDTGSVAAVAPTPFGAVWHVRLPDGGQIGPVELEDLRERIRTGSVPVGAQFSSDGHRFQSLASFKELSYLSSLEGLGGGAGLGGRSTYASQRGGFDVARLVTPILAILVVVGLGYLAWAQRADIARLYQGLVAAEEPEGPQRANPLRRYLASWRLAHPDVSGTAREHLRAAGDFHLEDTWEGYERAERAYQRALLLDENDPDAIAGYVENLALWRFPMASPAEVQVARSALEYAMELAPKSGAVRRAAGALAWVSGDLNGCRAGADAALAETGSDARARLILAGCYLEGNVQLAIREAQVAKRALPELARVDRILAEAFRRGGRFKSAYRILDERLRSHPKSASVHLAYGEIDAALARYDKAETRFRRAARLPGDRQVAWMAVGDLAMEQRNPAKAVTAFRRAAAESTPSGRRGAHLYAEWARAELSRGSAQRAIKLSEQALKLRARYVPALLVRSEAALRTGSATTAAALVRKALKERENEPAALVLAGRIDAVMDRGEAGLTKMRTAVRFDPKDARLHAVLAAQYLAVGQDPQAYATMRKAVDLDPARAWAVGRNNALTVSDSALLEAVERFRQSARSPRNASVAYASIGLIQHHRGDRATARESMRRALELDDANVLALIYDAQLALEVGDVVRAERSAARLLLVERGSALGHLLRARVHVRRREYDDAREEFQSALRSNPGLLAAEIELAAVELTDGTEEAASARSDLERAFTIEPDLLFLRQILFEHEA